MCHFLRPYLSPGEESQRDHVSASLKIKTLHINYIEITSFFFATVTLTLSEVHDDDDDDDAADF